MDSCPTGALQYDSQEYTIDTLMEKIKADTVFYQYGGGVTFSGGEPFFQGEFLVELLKRCKEEGLHTAIETSLYTSSALLREALPYLDLLYADLKIYDDDKHQEYTGVSNAIIKENLRILLQSDKKDNVIIRTPLIPNMTDSNENLYAIASYIVSLYPNVAYELLNYNALASSKYAYLDMEYTIDNTAQPFTKEQMEVFYKGIKNAGVKHIIKE